MQKLTVILSIKSQHIPGIVTRTLDTILRQSLREIEVFCVDPGTDAGLTGTLNDWAGRDTRVRVFQAQEEETGILPENACLRMASGEYVLFMDSGDRVFDYAWEALYDKAVRYQLDVLRFPLLYKDADTGDTFLEDPRDSLKALRPGDYHRLLGLEEGSVVYSLCTDSGLCLYRRSFLIEQEIWFDPFPVYNRRGIFWKAVVSGGRVMAARDIAIYRKITRLPAALGPAAADHSVKGPLTTGASEAADDCPESGAVATCLVKDVTTDHPESEAAAACPVKDAVANRPGSEAVATCPVKDAVADCPESETAAICPVKDAAADCPDSGAAARAELENVFGAVQAIDHYLCSRNVDLSVREAILTEEYEALTRVVGDLYAAVGAGEAEEKEAEEKEAVIAVCKELAKTYEGAYSWILTAKLRNLFKQLYKTGAPDRGRTEVRICHEECQAPKVSVVVPIYNVQDYLNEALHSLTVQTLEQIEFICVNDGSTDHSLTIVKEYAALDHRFRILDGENGGYGKAMNRGIDAARGEYLGILEPDDFVPKEMFLELYQAAKAQKADLVKADFYRFRLNPDGSLHMRLEKLSNDPTYYGRVLCPGDEQQTFKFVLNTWSGIYSLEFLKGWGIRHNETPGASFQDSGFWFQTFCRAKRAYFIEKPYYTYRMDNPGSSENNRKKVYSFTEEFRFIRNWMEKDPEVLEKFNRIYYARKFNALIHNYRRLVPSLQKEFLHHISEEFLEVYDQGILDRDIMMSETQWILFQEIVPDPDAYYTKVCVSVVMPVYNAQDYLRQTLDGLLALSEIPFEVICVNDGSTDQTGEILHAYEEQDDRVRVIDQENAGAGAARNTGMAYARGTYLAFLDADDIYEPEMLRIAYNKAEAMDADILVFRSDEYIEETGETRPVNQTIRYDLLPGGQPFAGTDIPQNIFRAFIGWPWDKLFRTSFIREEGLRFQELRTTNDLLFVFSAVVKAGRIVTLNKILAHHRTHEGSLSVTREKSWGCCYEALCALCTQLMAWDLYERFEQDFINYALYFSLWNLRTLRGTAYFRLYEQLQKEWLKDLGLLDHDRDYFYDREEYQWLQKLLTLDAQSFLFAQRDSAAEKNKVLRLQLKETKAQSTQEKQALRGKIQTLREKNQALRVKNQTLREKNQTLREKIEKLRERAARLQRSKEDLQEKEKTLKLENQELNRKYILMKDSASWKAGRALTWIPRKLKKIFSDRG